MIKATFTVAPNSNYEAHGFFLFEPVTIQVEAEDWDSLTSTETYLGEYPDIQNLKLFMRTADRMYGHSFNPERHTPRHIREVFMENRILFDVKPECPPDDFELPEGAVY